MHFSAHKKSKERTNINTANHYETPKLWNEEVHGACAKLTNTKFMQSHKSKNALKIFALKNPRNQVAASWASGTAVKITADRTANAKQSILTKGCQAILTQATPRRNLATILLQ